MSKTTTYTGYIAEYNKHKHKIFNYFYYRTYNDADLAEDLTSDTFVKAFEKIDTYNEEYAFSTWLYRIARNTLIDHSRSSKTQSLEDFAEDFRDEESHNFVDLIDSEIDMARVEEVITTLPKTQRVVVEKRFFEYKEIKEIAEEQDSNEVAVRKNISRAIASMKEVLGLLVLFLIQ